MEGISITVEATICSIKFYVKDAASNLKKFQYMRKNDRLVLESLQILVPSIQMKCVTFIKWEMLERGKVKLNEMVGLALIQ